MNEIGACRHRDGFGMVNARKLRKASLRAPHHTITEGKAAHLCTQSNDDPRRIDSGWPRCGIAMQSDTSDEFAAIQRGRMHFDQYIVITGHWLGCLALLDRRLSVDDRHPPSLHCLLQVLDRNGRAPILVGRLRMRQ